MPAETVAAQVTNDVHAWEAGGAESPKRSQPGSARGWPRTRQHLRRCWR